MRFLYLWNDLSIFFSFDRSKLEKKLSDLIYKMNHSNKCKYIYVGYDHLNKWIYQLKKQGIVNLVTVGTRPDLIELEGLQNKANIKFQRNINEKGYTDRIELVDSDNRLNEFPIQGIIHVIEDVLVTGKTLNYLLDLFCKMNFQGQLVIHLFMANRNSLKKLHTNLPFKVYLDIHSFMDGEPIKQSTCLCLYDLIFNKLGEQYYKERIDLLEIYFYDYTSELIQFTIWAENYLNQKKISIDHEGSR